MHGSNDSSHSHDVCSICDLEDPKPEWCCAQCDENGLPYHGSCWMSERHHRRANCNPPHQQIPINEFQRLPQVMGGLTIEDSQRLDFLAEPNRKASIEDETFLSDYMNCFVFFDVESKTFRFGPRAHPLLRREHGQYLTQYPSFVSFVGRTGNGKSYLLRALLEHRETSDQFPTPIPAAGGGTRLNFSSTSSDIHLYADHKTAESESPILFLDCEGYDGSDKPTSYAARTKKMALDAIDSIAQWKERREYVEDAYSRFIYAFSTCVIFVTSGPPAEAASIGRRLLRCASQGASGSQNQGFKPSLFIVFNKFVDDRPGLDWSISSSTKDFLSLKELEDLKLFYHEIRVIYIPTLRGGNSNLALSQITALQRCLREDHESAFRRRGQEFGLIFNPGLLMYFLSRALTLFSKSHSSVFNWSFETSREGFGSSEAFAAYLDLWIQCTKHYAPLAKSSWELYRSTRETFERHVESCLRLQLARALPLRPGPGQGGLTIPHAMEIVIQHIDRLLLDHAPCAAKVDSVLMKCKECKETKHRHGDHHQGPNSIPLFPAARWQGRYEHYENSPFQTFRELFETALSRPSAYEVSCVSALGQLPRDVCSTSSCFGCLQGPPNTFLDCGHGFCTDCVHELLQNRSMLHRVRTIHCPFHNTLQHFSPRLLPNQSGYRILTLDGGGAKGLAELVMLRHIESRCFQIPTKHLFDLIIGTSVGGVIALALTMGFVRIGKVHEEAPLTVAEAIQNFKDLARNGFQNESEFSRFFTVSHWLDKETVYKTKSFEMQLQRLFGKTATVYSAPCYMQPIGIPNVAVTAVVLDQFQPYLVANYNRNTIPGAVPLLPQPDLDARLPIWAAARCTSSAAPHVDTFLWQGQMFLDGSFELSCPASAALSEAQSLWPGRRRDTLVSLGTGIPMSRKRPSEHDSLKFGKKEVVVDTSSEDLWDKFPSKDEFGIFRLNPVHDGAGFTLRDFDKLREVEQHTDRWLSSPDIHAQLTLLCDHLIAALFYFRQSKSTANDLNGEILCRLPVDLEARRNLIHQMQRENDKGLFLVQLGENYSRIITVAESAIHIHSRNELRIPLVLHGLPSEEMEIQVKMRNMGYNRPAIPSSYRWCPISGSPYTFKV